jgi:hypothetical protein
MTIPSTVRTAVGLAEAHLLQFATQSGGNLLIPHKAMPSAAKS